MFWCASLFLLLFGFLSAPSGLCVPLLLFFLCPNVLRLSVVSGPGCPGPRCFVAACPPLLCSLPAVRLFLPLSAPCLGKVWLGFVFLPPLRPFVWCVRFALVLCRRPPPRPLRQLLLVFCAVTRLVEWLRGQVWAVLCGMRCFPMLCCALLCWYAGALLFVVLSCCVVGFVSGRLPLALTALFPLLLCSALLRCADVCSVLSCVCCLCVLLCAVVLPLVLCGVAVRCVVWSCGPLRRAALSWFCRVVQLCPLPPLLLPLVLGWALHPVVLCGVLLCAWCCAALC